MFKLIILFFTLLNSNNVTVGSFYEVTIPANSVCQNKNYIEYYPNQRIVCIPSDLIFKDSFNN